MTEVTQSEDDHGSETIVAQRDSETGIVTSTSIRCPHNAAAYRFETTVTNSSHTAVTVTALSSFTLRFGHSETDLDNIWVRGARSEWLAENRWWEEPIRTVLPRLSLSLHGQDGRGHYGVTSHGTWSSGEHLPAGILHHRDGNAVAWQVETSGPWHWELSQTQEGGVLTVLGATDAEHHFAVTLNPGEHFTGVPATVSVSTRGPDGAIAELTRYRRWLRSISSAHDELPVVYNDFMNTLMGQPSTEALLPLIDAAADAGVECFCIDAGWHADPALGGWWASVGEWRESPKRFTNGLREVIDAIHARGMRSGIWLEPEVIGVNSPAANTLPEEAFFQRFGTRVVEHERYHLDLRHPAAREHLDEAIDRLVTDYGISYVKLDYNINPGVGTDNDAVAPGAGLLGHTRALGAWIESVRARHPQVSIENCSSGAMRADYHLLAVTQLQSTSDQQDFRLYPPIAASAPATIVPEQCGNWAYPAADMTLEEVHFTLITGLAGRLYLSGFLHELAADARAMVARAVATHASWRPWLRQAEPFWPLGLPGWDDETVCLGLSDGATTRLFVWDRAEAARRIVVPLPEDHAGKRVAFVSLSTGVAEWGADHTAAELILDSVPGVTARVIELTHG